MMPVMWGTLLLSLWFPPFVIVVGALLVVVSKHAGGGSRQEIHTGS